MIQSPIAFPFRSSVRPNNLGDGNQARRINGSIYSGVLPVSAASQVRWRVFPNWNDIGTGAQGPKASSERQFPPAKCARFSSALQRACCCECSRLWTFRSAGGFIVRPEVIPMLIPLCPRGWTEVQAVVVASRRSFRHDYVCETKR